MWSGGKVVNLKECCILLVAGQGQRDGCQKVSGDLFGTVSKLLIGYYVGKREDASVTLLHDRMMGRGKMLWVNSLFKLISQKKIMSQFFSILRFIKV